MREQPLLQGMGVRGIDDEKREGEGLLLPAMNLGLELRKKLGRELLCLLEQYLCLVSCPLL